MKIEKIRGVKRDRASIHQETRKVRSLKLFSGSKMKLSGILTQDVFSAEIKVTEFTLKRPHDKRTKMIRTMIQRRNRKQEERE